MDGKALAARVRAEVAAEVAELGPVGLATVLVGDDPASDVYIRAKHTASQEVGIEARDLRLSSGTSEEELLRVVTELNADDAVDGILVQLPLPAGVDEERVIRALDPVKDVDGFHPVNAGQLYLGRPTYVPGTALGVIALLEAYDVELVGAHAVVVGRSDIVGKPVAMLLLQRHATVTICHSRTRDLAGEVASRGRRRRGGRHPRARAGGVDQGRLVPDRRRYHPHRHRSRRRHRSGCRRTRRADHAGAGRCRPDDRGDAASQHRSCRSLPPRGACVSGHVRLCFARL